MNALNYITILKVSSFFGIFFVIPFFALFLCLISHSLFLLSLIVYYKCECSLYYNCVNI